MAIGSGIQFGPYEILSPLGAGGMGEVMNAIFKEDPPELGETNARAPQGLERLIRRCLEKKPERRFHSAYDLGYALEALSFSSGARLENVGAASVRKPERLAWLAVALSLGMLGFAWAYITRQPMTNDAQVMKFSILPPEKSSFGQIAVAPDGRHLAFTAGTGGKFQLWVRALDSTEARALAGTQGATLPFWSTDSRFIGFFADGRVKKIEFTGGPVQTLYEAPLPSGGAWSRAGVILFGQAAFGLLRISATGGEVTQMTTRDISRQEIAHSFPNFLPDGRHFLYAGDGKLMAAQASRGESFEVDAAVSLFEFRAGTHQVTFAPYAVTADGQRFLINAVVETEPNAPLTVVVNWAAGAPKSNGK